MFLKYIDDHLIIKYKSSLTAENFDVDHARHMKQVKYSKLFEKSSTYLVIVIFADINCDR